MAINSCTKKTTACITGPTEVEENTSENIPGVAATQIILSGV